ncbi:hypothetical protein [Methanococcus maripaludis]|uniref:Uncharacterized protein n=2 Tax=Methanococcus maripaludis TaxID=39152 RepID=A0A7J9PQ13_METMI|nr:hypothetical protein [Methanococcus maripaludis]MBA2861304.1 hypothetical protein [Methanococcus maripaludis]MBA2868234.1 hypothetical protein [Methanococcus maripaludis]
MKSYKIKLFFSGDEDIVKTETVEAENPFEAKELLLKKYGAVKPRLQDKTLEILSKIEILDYNII